MAWSVYSQLGSYRLLSVVRSGRNCQVWEAMHGARNEKVALKIVMPEFRNDKEQIALMKREFSAGSAFKHPRVVQIYEMVMEENAYVAMEYFPAPNMKQLILQGVERIAYLVPRIVEHAADGLDYVHRQGWVHRDIKPDNFLIDKEGNTKLIDFALAEKPKGGLARLFAGKSKIQGTRSYMSPEQIRGQPVDQRADIYSFGCTVFELIIGKTPFTGQSSNDLLMKHLQAAPPALEANNKNITLQFGQLIRKTLAKDPKGRPQSMAEFIKEMKAIRIFKILPAMPTDVQPEKTR